MPQPQSRSKPPRENQFPGRSPQPSGGGDPTYRKPATQVASVPPTNGRSPAPVKGDALALVKALRGFGVPESVLEQVQASLVPPKRDPGNAGEKALSDCKAQLHILRQRVVKQRMAVSNAQEALERSKEKLTGLEDEVAKLDLRYRELSVDPLTPSSFKVASEVGDGPHLAEVQSCSDGMDLTGQDGDWIPRDPRLAVHPRGRIVLPSAPFVQNEDASKRCRVATAFSHDSVLNAAANGQLSQQDGAQLIAHFWVV